MNNNYQVRQDILHTHAVHIEDLSKDKAALVSQLHVAESKIGRLELEVQRLEHEKIALNIKLQEANNSAHRLDLIAGH